ncbi:MAG: hypothetical protein ACT4P7_02345 [Gemmatimonadaceae bacterium]
MAARRAPALVYYRFQHEQPRVGEEVHCFRDFLQFQGFVRMMRRDDPDSRQMRFWEIQGQFVRNDEDDVVVRVVSAREIAV